MLKHHNNTRRIQGPKNSIIKNDQVQIGSIRKIEPEELLKKEHSTSHITPIKSDEHIIGFTFHCSCGETAQILFDYDSDDNINVKAG
jgi:hypothetical protein